MAKLAAVWNKAFTSGSKSLQDRLKKVHANNPEFQSWLKSSGHGAGESVKQASKEVKPTARVQTLQQKSLKAYGATKGTRMGSEDGSGEAIRDTIAPLTRDQHAKVQSAEREAKAAAKKAAPAAPKKPLSTSQRLSAIAAAVRKAKAKHDVPTMEPDDEGHDDLRDVHQSLHIRSGYNEEVEQLDHEAANWRRVSAMPKGSATGGKDEVNKHLAYLKAVHDHRKKFGYDTKSVRDKIERINRSGIAEEVEQVDEGKVAKALAVGAMTLASMGAKAHTDTTKSVAQLAKERPALAQRLKDIGAEGQVPASDVRAAELQKKQDQEMPASERRAKELEKMKKEEFDLQEEPKSEADAGEYDYEGDMAKSQLRSILANAKRLHDMLEENTNLPEWVQSKITLAQDYILTAASYMEGEMNEEVEQIDELKKSTLASYTGKAAKDAATHSAMASYHDTSARARGKHRPDSKIHMTLADIRGAKSKKRLAGIEKATAKLAREEVEQVDEANMRFDPEAAARPTSRDVKNFQMRDKNPRAAAASKKYIRRMTKLGGLGPNQTKKDTEAHMKAHFDEETGADKRDAGYKMSPAVRAAQAKSDKLSKIKSKYQAGTLAVQRAMEKELQYNPKYRMEEVEQIEEGNPENKAKKKEYVRGIGLKAMKAGKVDPARGHIPQRAGREELRKEEVEQIEEVTKKEAETALGGPVKTMTGNEPKGKLPLGFRKARSNARKAAKAAETAIKLAKGKVNKVNTKPELTSDNNGK